MQAQQRMKHFADKKMYERILQVGDWVYMKLQPYRQVTIAIRTNVKLSPKFYGPYLITKKVGVVLYRLQLPLDSIIHPIFHVTHLKKMVKTGAILPGEPLVTGLDGEVLAELLVVLDKRIVKKNNAAEIEILVQWANLPAKEATWESTTMLRSNFHILILVSKDLLKRRGM